MKMLFIFATSGLLFTTATAIGAELEKCGEMKPDERMACLERNITTLNEALKNALISGHEVRIRTRGNWCLSWTDNNKPPRMLTCDHPDLQNYTISTP
ncbi:hypothetical protein [Taklimakanibacter deserti]|uniref:hypothetical protein n=1 Tax=Taklimakanibacter deserti TaxID=2267839 RepID=UPI000E648BE8